MCRYLTASTTQTIIMGQMERRRKAVYGPTLGKKAIFFLDDIHTETLNTRTTDRLDMLLRQCIHHGHIFDSKDGEPSSQLVDINFLATSRLSDASNDILDDFAPVVIEPIQVGHPHPNLAFQYPNQADTPYSYNSQI